MHPSEPEPTPERPDPPDRLAEPERQDSDDPGAILRLIFDHAGEGISVFDAQLRLVAWNTRFVELSGLPPEQVHRGARVRSLMLALARVGEFGPVGLTDPEAAALARLRAVSSGPGGVSWRVRPNGRTLETRRNPIPGGGFVMLYQDITERRAAEAKLADQQRMLTLLVERTEQGFWFIDNELRTTDANPAMCRMLRIAREDMLGRNIYEFVDEENAEIFRYRTKLRAQGLASAYEIVLKRADGSRVPCWNNATPLFDAAGAKAGALGMFSDISPLKEAEAQARHAGELLAQKSRLLESTLESLSQGVLAIDAAGYVSNWNQRLVELLKLSPVLLESRPSQAVLLQQTRDLSLAREGDPTSAHAGGRYQIERADGVVIEVQTREAADGSQVRTYTDISDAVRVQQALMAARDEAERANRAKSDFLSRMSHELRTPLNAVLGFAQLLDTDTADPLSPMQSARVHELQRGGRHLLSLINEVLDLSRIEAGALQLQLAPVPLAALVGECLRMVHPMAEARGIVLQVAPATGAACTVLADPTRLKQVLLNLLSNAVKYNRDQGRVTLSWRTLAANTSRVRIDVQDSGPGLDAMQQERLFQAFERLDAEGTEVEGAGIGLALSKWLVNLMRGEIGVDSAPGQGSTFWVQLDAAGAAASVDAPPPDAGVADAVQATVPAAVAAGTPHTVLYVEDNPVNQLLMAGMLARRAGIKLVTAPAGPEGLALAALEPPDLVLLDIHLPGMDGYEVLRRLRQVPATRHVPAIAVSANAMPSDIEAARAAGFDDYVTKPLDMALLLAAVERALQAASAGR